MFQWNKKNNNSGSILDLPEWKAAIRSRASIMTSGKEKGRKSEIKKES